MSHGDENESKMETVEKTSLLKLIRKSIKQIAIN